MKKKRVQKGIVVIGELNVDAVLTGLSDEPKMGAEILATDFQVTLGSASAIFASGIAKLGHPVTFIGKVGTDNFGGFCLSALREAGISTRHVLRDEYAKTGVTVSLSTAGDRALITYLGAIAALGHQDIPMASLKGQNHLHMTSYFLQTRLRASFPKILRAARELGLSTSFDPNSDPSRIWNDRIRDVFTYTDILFLNEAEALQLSGARTVRAALKSLATDVPCAVVKQGARGAVAIKDGKITSVRGFKVNTVDTTGAGDSFAAGFISSYLRGGSIAECLSAGNACGALSAKYAGGTAGQPSRQALTRFLASRVSTDDLS